MEMQAPKQSLAAHFAHKTWKKAAHSNSSASLEKITVQAETMKTTTAEPFRFEFNVTEEKHGPIKRKNKKKKKSKQKQPHIAILEDEASETHGMHVTKEEQSSSTMPTSAAQKPRETFADPSKNSFTIDQPSNENNQKKKKTKQGEHEISQSVEPLKKSPSAAGTISSSSSRSFLTLRKATGSESEVARMQLRYGNGRRNLAALALREATRRKKELRNQNTTAQPQDKEVLENKDDQSAVISASMDSLSINGGSFKFNFDATQ